MCGNFRNDFIMQESIYSQQTHHEQSIEIIPKVFFAWHCGTVLSTAHHARVVGNQSAMKAPIKSINQPASKLPKHRNATTPRYHLLTILCEPPTNHTRIQLLKKKCTHRINLKEHQDLIRVWTCLVRILVSEILFYAIRVRVSPRWSSGSRPEWNSSL